MIVDVHPHLLADDTVNYPVSPIEGELRDSSKGLRNTVDEFIADMDEAGVEKAAIVQTSTVYGFDNSYVADSIERFPDRLVGIGCIDPQANDAPAQLDHWITKRGLRGIRIFTSGITAEEAGAWLDDPAVNPFWAWAAELKVPIDIATRLRSLPRVHKVAERFPDLQLLIESGKTLDNATLSDSIADGPPYGDAKAYFDLAQYPNVSIKFTNNTFIGMAKGRSTAEQFLAEIVKTFGARRAIWGSNYPHTLPPEGTASPYKYLVDQARQTISCLSEDDQAWVFGTTAITMFPGLQ